MTENKILVKQSTAAPTRKVQAMALGGSLSIIALGIFAAAYPELHGRLPENFGGGLATVLGTFLAYMTRDRV